MPGLIFASVPVNSEAGSYMTFAGPVGLFVVVAAILYLLTSRPHRRVPPRRALDPGKARTSGTGDVSGALSAETRGPEENTEAGE